MGKLRPEVAPARGAEPEHAGPPLIPGEPPPAGSLREGKGLVSGGPDLPPTLPLSAPAKTSGRGLILGAGRKADRPPREARVGRTDWPRDRWGAGGNPPNLGSPRGGEAPLSRGRAPSAHSARTWPHAGRGHQSACADSLRAYCVRPAAGRPHRGAHAGRAVRADSCFQPRSPQRPGSKRSHSKCLSID